MRVVEVRRAGTDHSVGGGGTAGEGAEVFAAHHARQADDMFRAEAGGGEFAHDGGFRRIVPGNVVADLVVEFVARAVCRAEVFDEVFDGFTCKLTVFFAGGADAADEFGAVGDDVKIYTICFILYGQMLIFAVDRKSVV